MIYPLARCGHGADTRFYHAFGSTPPQDFLQNCSGTKHPAILVLGYGDISSCLFSLWKNFDLKGPTRFDGVHFFLNDINAAVTARSVLFLYLCIHLPQEEMELKKQLCGLWAIWFCHELYPDHNELLHKSLQALIKYSDDWSSKDNPLYPLVKFSSPTTSCEVGKVWKMWLHLSVSGASVEEMHSFRKTSFLKFDPFLQFEASAVNFVEQSAEITSEKLPFSKDSEAKKLEVIKYMEKGSVDAERLFGLLAPVTKTFVNVTFFDREDGSYNLYCQSLPFKCFFHSVKFLKRNYGDAIFNYLVPKKFFELWPLLANSVQQFSLWAQAARKALKPKDVCFTFDCSHALDFCCEQENASSSQFPKLDLIYTSNLADRLSLLNVVLSAVPLLKGNGLVFTSTLQKMEFGSLDQYISTSFGFDSKLLPILLGIRCINHEGGSYSSPIAVQPHPYTKEGTCSLVLSESVLIWERLKSDTIPLVFSPEQQLYSVITTALLSSIQASVLSLMQPLPNSPAVMSNMCVETAVKFLKTFMSHISADVGPQFWMPLCDAMQGGMKPYLHNIQTQLILHGVHIHLTVTELDCPICLKVPVNDHISLISARSFVKTTSSSRFVAFVHKEVTDDAVVLRAASFTGDVHIFDCVSPTPRSHRASFLDLCFYTPLALVEEKYKVTFATCLVSQTRAIPAKVVDLPTKALSCYQGTFSGFKFFKATPPDVNYSLKSFGSVTSHLSDGDSSDFEIALYPEVTTCLAKEKLQTRTISSTSLELSFGDKACQLNFPYPVAFDSVKVRLSKKKGLINIHCPRASQNFTEEQPLFIVSPDHKLSLFPLLMSQDDIASLCGQQFMEEEASLIQLCDHASTELSPLTRVKVLFLYLFQREKHFFRFVQPNGCVSGLVLVNNWLLSYEARTPVVDLAFCFLEESTMEVLLPAWDSIPPQEIQSIELSISECDILKQVFLYFGRKTNASFSSSNASKDDFTWLREKNIEQYFTRAVATFLFCNTDKFSPTIGQKMMSLLPSEVVDEKCSHCGKVSNSLNVCSKCQAAKCCGEKCHSAHLCSQPKLHSAAKESTFRPFPVSRYWYGGDFRFYYAYGNTPAENFLENCSGIKQPQVLSLGCGDIRSCFYTIWKHFDSSLPKALQEFEGVHFTLNDNSTPVQARNIVFLYLCLMLPPKADERKHWLCAMWSIWYCHELHSNHRAVLDGALGTLLKYSGSIEQWSHADNPLWHLVKFTSPVVLHEISQIWKIWLKREVNVMSVEQMNFSRLAELERRDVIRTLDAYSFSYAHSVTFIIGENPGTEACRTKQPEVINYVKCGSCYAESVMDLDLPTLPTTVNLTLYERADGVYNLHYGSIPFSGYYHTVLFSPEAMKLAGVKKNRCDALVVKSQSFKSLPFLSNSFQQFALWIQSANKVLVSTQDRRFSFTFNNLDALAFCQELRHMEDSFDVIYTSNLIDHISPPNVILSAIPLLNENGLLLSTSLLYKNFTSSLDEYIARCFGFDLKLLPDILGVRCINHEGSEYASTVMVEPIPVHVADMIKLMRQDRTLIWQKLPVQPLVLPKLPQLESGNVVDGIFDAFQVCAYPLFTNSGEGRRIMNHQCVETAILVLQTFASSISADVRNYRFWESLSSVFYHKMKPFLNCLQTQLLLHKVHMHLTLTEENCPVCKLSSVNEYLGLFCLEVLLPLPYVTPNFLALIHQYSSNDAHYLCQEAISGKDVHIFDSIDGFVENGALKLNFFAPLKFVEKGYNVTIALSHLPEKTMIISCLSTRSLQSALVDFVEYSFSPISPFLQSNSEESSFGKLVFHLGDGDKVQSEISLTDLALRASKEHKLGTKKISSNEVELMCGEYHFHLKYKYPVDYNRISIKLSRAEKSVQITSPRQAHDFTEEKPMCVVIPDHQLSIPPQHVKDAIMICHSGLQMNNKERKILEACNRDCALLPPLLNVKETFMYFFQCKNPPFSFVSPQNNLLGVVVINQCLFDYHYKTPVMDLAFYFIQPSSKHAVLRAVRCMSLMPIIVNESEYQILHKALAYFASRTNGTIRSACKPNKFEQLQKLNIDHYFTRAVVYLLYGDPDVCGNDMLEKMPAAESSSFRTPSAAPACNPSTDKKCDYCKKYCPTTKKCASCKTVEYCSKDCQAKHWRLHSKDCKKATLDKDLKSVGSAKENTPVSDSAISSKPLEQMKRVCSFCKRCSDTLKKCKRCGVAQYCNRECQVGHWPKHKLECNAMSKFGSLSSELTCSSTAADKSMASASEGPPTIESCAFCGLRSAKLKKCLRCNKTKYCGRECQRRHWSSHKLNCM